MNLLGPFIGGTPSLPQHGLVGEINLVKYGSILKAVANLPQHGLAIRLVISMVYSISGSRPV